MFPVFLFGNSALYSRCQSNTSAWGLWNNLDDAYDSQICYKDEDSNTLLHIAVLYKRRHLVGVLLSHDRCQNIGLHDKNKNGDTPLLLAAAMGDLEMVRAFLSDAPACKTLNIQNNADKTPLFCAAEKGHTAVVEALLEKSDIDTINALTTLKRSPIEIAAAHGHLDIVSLLLDKSNELNRIAAFLSAAKNGHKDILVCIGKFFATNSIALPPVDQTRYLLLAMLNGHTETCEDILDACFKDSSSQPFDLNYTEKAYLNLYETLKEAARKNHKQIIIKLFEKIPFQTQNIDDRCPANLKALIQTAWGNKAALQSLQEEQIKDIKDNEGNNLLHIAALYGHESLCEQYIQKGLKIDSKNSAGETPLMLAARNGNPEIVTWLLEKNPNNIDALNNEDESALSIAARSGNYAIVKTLLKAGADINLKNKKGHRALRIALDSGHPDIAQLIVQFHPSINKTELRKYYFQCGIKKGIRLSWKTTKHWMKQKQWDQSLNFFKQLFERKDENTNQSLNTSDFDAQKNVEKTKKLKKRFHKHEGLIYRSEKKGRSTHLVFSHKNPKSSDKPQNKRQSPSDQSVVETKRQANRQ